MTAEPTAPEAVSAEPTKDFFISMLVRDIGLIPAIVDLVDNSIDGARRLRPVDAAESNGRRFEGLWIQIRADAESFEIQDNCGGIEWPIARDYAFRFGRPKDAPSTPDSIGQFGIGMKRALFKLGTQFSVRSATTEERFSLEVDVDQWRSSPKWTFPDVTYTSGSSESDAVGTDIVVSALHDSVGEEFGYERFHSELAEELSRIHQGSMSRGLKISLNGIPVDVDILTLLQSEVLRPARFSIVLDEDTEKPVHIELFAGIDASSPPDAGWYVYCNARLILGPDRSRITGWGEGASKAIPQYHNQYARFRGYAFFESAAVDKLPWTTTKDGVDTGHRIFRAVRPSMVDVMRPVIKFLNALDAEKDHPPRDRESLELMVSAAEENKTPLSEIAVSSSFVTPERPPLPRKPETQSIQYRRPVDLIEAAKKMLKVRSARQVGEGTFDYFIERELDDDG